MSTHPNEADLDSLLSRLSEAGVKFIVVGGAAAVLHGAPITTQDLDIVPLTAAQNIDELMSVLTGLDARIRDLAGRNLALDRSALEGSGQTKLTTSQGPLDLLCSLHDGRDYEALLPNTVEMTDGDLRLRVIDLPTLIAIKSSTGRARDQLVVPILTALAREQGSL